MYPLKINGNIIGQIGDVNLTKVEDIDNISTLSNTLATRFAGETVRVSSSTLHGSLSKYQESSTADILMQFLSMT